MKGRNRVLSVVVTVPLILVVVGVLVWQHNSRTTAIRLRQDKESFEAQIAQNLSPGSNKAIVRRFLDSRHMTYVDTPPIPDLASANDKVASLIEATSRDSIELPFGSCSISAKFRFDSDGALLGYTDWHSCKWVW